MVVVVLLGVGSLSPVITSAELKEQKCNDSYTANFSFSYRK